MSPSISFLSDKDNLKNDRDFLSIFEIEFTIYRESAATVWKGKVTKSFKGDYGCDTKYHSHGITIQYLTYNGVYVYILRGCAELL